MDEGIDDDPAFHLPSDPEDKWNALSENQRRRIGSALMMAYRSPECRTAVEALPVPLMRVIKAFIKKEDGLDAGWHSTAGDQLLQDGKLPWARWHNNSMENMEDIIDILHYCGLTKDVEEAFKVDDLHFWRTVRTERDRFYHGGYGVVKSEKGPFGPLTTIADFTQAH